LTIATATISATISVASRASGVAKVAGLLEYAFRAPMTVPW
jgi:hypothetical protein